MFTTKQRCSAICGVWNSGYFEECPHGARNNAQGWLIHIYVHEKPTIRTIELQRLIRSRKRRAERYRKSKSIDGGQSL